MDTDTTKTAKFNADWFTYKLEQRQLSKRSLAKLMDLDPAAVSLMLRGMRKMSSAECVEVAKHIGASVSDVLQAAGITVEDSHEEMALRITGWIDGDGAVVAKKPMGPIIVDRPPGAIDGITALRVQAPGQPFDGWVVYFQRPPAQTVSDECLGRLCLCQEENGLIQFSMLNRGYEFGKFNLGGAFNRIKNGVKLIWATPVTWMKQI